MWTAVGAAGLVLLVAGLAVLGWIVAGIAGAAAAGLIAAGAALVWAALDALAEPDVPEVDA